MVLLMNKTTNIKLYNVNIKIVEKNKQAMDLITQDSMGVFHTSLNTIWIRECLSLEVKRLTLIHELVHAIVYNMGYSKESIKQEELCDFVAFHHREISRICDIYFKNKKEGNL